MSKRDELRKQIQGASARRYATVAVPGQPEYLIRSLTMKEKGENELIPVNIKTGTIDTSKMSQQKCDLLCRSVVDPDDREPLFATSEWQIWESVAAPITSRLVAEIDKLNEGQAVEGLVGNSDTTGG